MKNLLCLVLLFFVFGCSQKKEEKVIITESNVYKQSEMAALMLQMYAVNLNNKQLILNGKTPTDFPEEFKNIHTAKLTDPADRNASFKTFSNAYLNTFNQTAKTNQEKHNNIVNSCITCHKTTCIGPIPKIKKLLIP